MNIGRLTIQQKLFSFADLAEQLKTHLTQHLLPDEVPMSSQADRIRPDSVQGARKGEYAQTTPRTQDEHNFKDDKILRQTMVNFKGIV